MTKFTRERVIERLRAKLALGRPLIGAGAGTALIGQILEEAEVDMIFAYCTGEFRLDGYPSVYGNMPFQDCDVQSLKQIKLLNAVVKNTPVIAGLGSGGPNADYATLMDQFVEAGYAGVINVPLSPYQPLGPGLSIGMQGEYRKKINSGLDGAVEMVATAAKKNIFSCGYGFTDEALIKFAAAGADLLIPHMGLTLGGSCGAYSKDVDANREAEYERLARMCELCYRENPNALIIAHGGLLSTPESVKPAFETSRTMGFIGASSTERLPIEKGIKETMLQLRTIKKR
ncbi:MAG: phosphoenolpyruvate hydrolase family protein [Candidatus Alectryocaccobium sp.]|jgi:predicted TIM-barrel enzyme